MRKKTQLADLILGSGLVGDSSRRLQASDSTGQIEAGRPASAAGASTQPCTAPALYQFRGSTSLRRPNSAVKAAAAAAPQSHGLGVAGAEARITSRPSWESTERSSCHAQNLDPVCLEGSIMPAVCWQAPDETNGCYEQGVSWVPTPEAVASAPELERDVNEAGTVCAKDVPASQTFAVDEVSQLPAQADMIHADSAKLSRQGSLNSRSTSAGVSANTSSSEVWRQDLSNSGSHQPSLTMSRSSCKQHHQQQVGGVLANSPSVPIQTTMDAVPTAAAYSTRVEASGPKTVLQLPRAWSTTPGSSSKLTRTMQPELSSMGAQQQAPAGAMPSSETVLSVQSSQEASKVAEMQGQVKQLQAQLEACEQQLHAAQQQAVEASSRLQEERDQANLKHLRAVKQAEGAQERAEAGRRAAERRAAVAQNEIMQLQAALSTKDATHQQSVQSLQLALESAQSAARTQTSLLEADIARLRQEVQAAHAATHTTVHEQKRAHEEAEERLRQEVARRTQTILSLNNDFEALKQREKQLEAQLAALSSKQPPQLEAQSNTVEPLNEVSSSQAQQDSSSVPADRKSGAAVCTSSTFLPKQIETMQRAHSIGNSSIYSHDPARLRTAASVKSLSRQGSGMAGCEDSGAVNAAKLAQLHQELKTQLAQVRQEYAQRLVNSEDAVLAAENAAREAATTFQQLFQSLVDRTALLLAGRLPFPMPHARGMADAPIVTLNPSASMSLPAQLALALDAAAAVAHQPAPLVQRPPTPSKRASAAAAAAGNDKLALLYAMNDRLSSENAKLLAELARFHSGKHPMLRRASMTIVGAAECTSTPVQATQPGLIAPATPGGHKRSLSDSGSTSNAADGFMQQPGVPAGKLPGARASYTGSVSTGSGVSRSSMEHTGSLSSSQGHIQAGVGGHANVTAAKMALSAAVKEVLCCVKRQSLPVVLSGEGWQQQGKPGLDVHSAVMQCQLNSMAEAALSAAEQLIQSQSQNMALSQQCAALQQQVIAAANQAADQQEAHMEEKGRLGQLAAQLTASQQQVVQLQEQLRSARYCTSSTDTIQHSSKDAQLTDQLITARDEVQRQRNTAAAANRARDQLTRQLSDQQDSVRRMESQLREVKYSLQQEQDATKRLRVLLTQARGLLKAAGIPFMEEDAGAIPSQPAASEPVFKAVDARERTKEMQRLAAELAVWQHKATAASKELQALRAAHKRQEAALQQAVTAAQAQAAQEVHAANLLVAAAQAARDQAEQRASSSAVVSAGMQHQVQELSSELDKLRAHTQYLKQRTTQMKQQRKKLSYAPTLSISIDGGSPLTTS